MKKVPLHSLPAKTVLYGGFFFLFSFFVSKHRFPSFPATQVQTLSCFAVSPDSCRGKQETYQRIPGSGAQADAVVADAQAADSVVVPNERADTLAAQHIPHLP